MTTQDSAGGVPLAVLLEHREWVRALARSLVSDADRADDVEQETWRMALERPPRHGASIRAWFRVVVRNAARKSWRSEQTAAGVELRASERPPVPSPADLVAQAEVQHRVVHAVLELNEPYRSTILYRFYEALPPREIAARLDVPVETVRTRLKRGIARLRERLQDELSDEPRAWSLLLLGYTPRDGSLPPPKTATGAGTTTGFRGGLAVAHMTKGLVVGAAILLLAFSVAWMTDDASDPSDPTDVDPVRMAGADTRQSNGRGRTAPPLGESAESAPCDTIDPDVRDLDRGTPAPASGHDGEPGAGARDVPRRVRVSPAAKTPPESSVADVVDLDACDRDRDLHGRVLDLEGTPVAGARVVILQRPPWGETLRAPVQWERRFHEGLETRSGTDGTFSIRLESGRGVGLRIEADGFSRWQSRMRQAGERLTARLSSAMPLDVRVLTHERTPAAGVPVSLFLEPREGEGRRAGATTDAGGRATFPTAPAGAEATLSVVTHALRIAHTTFVIRDGSRSMEFVLPATRVLRGRVNDAATGVGIAGASVGLGFGTPALTDSLGRFEVEVYGKGRVQAEAHGYAARTMSVPAQTGIVFELLRAARVIGRVIDDAGQPVVGADIALLGSSPLLGRSRSTGSNATGAVTGDDGRFVADGLTPGLQYLLRVEGDGHALLYMGMFIPVTRRSPVDVGDVVLQAPHTLRGVVIDADGLPLARVALYISGPNKGGGKVIHLRRASDDLGRFAFSDLPGGRYELEASGNGLRRTFDAVVPHVGESPTLTVRLVSEPEVVRETIPLTVTVRDEEGTPVAGVRVAVGYVTNGAIQSTTSDTSGTISLAAEYEPAWVSVRLSRDQTMRWQALHQWVRPGERDMSLLLRRGETIAGRVVDAKGKPVASAFVEAVVGARQVAALSADDDGRFALVVRPGTPVDLRTNPPQLGDVPTRRAASKQGVEPGTEDIVLRIGGEPESRTVTVEVVDLEGEPLGGVALQARFAGQDRSKPSAGTTDKDGRVELADLPRTPVTLNVYFPAAKSIDMWSLLPRTIASDEDSVRIVMEEPRVLRGRVLDERGGAAPGALVRISFFGALCRTITDARGRFQIRVPTAAKYPFPVIARPRSLDPQWPLSGYDLVEDDVRELKIVLRPVPAR